jgi:hypothetical protein
MFGRSGPKPGNIGAPSPVYLPRGMRNIALLPLVVALAAASGCQAWTGASVPGLPEQSATEAGGRAAAIYGAVVRELVTKDRTYGTGPSRFERVFLIRTAANPYVGEESVPRPFTPAVARGIEKNLRDLPPVHFVADPDAVIVERWPCRGLGVAKGGVLVAVGPIAGARGRAVTVATFLVSGCLGKNGQWLTYVLEPRDGAWRVIGTKGPIAIG